MMNNRVLELLKNPKNIQSEDLHLLKEEINSFPYIQNIRALHLYGVHLYDRENYQKLLSTTAAYTTDKKILYQLINGKIRQQSKPEEAEIKPENIPESLENETLQEENINSVEKAGLTENAKTEFSSSHDYEAAALEALRVTKPEIKHIVVDGERNRILFEGEENFLNEDNNETIDLESTLESGVIVTQKPLNLTSEDISSDENNVLNTSKTQQIENAGHETENVNQKVEDVTDSQGIPESILNPETIVDEDKITSEKVEEEVNDDAELSFHEVMPVEKEISQQEAVDELENVEFKENLNSELSVEEEKIESEEITEEVNNDAELSFHEVQPLETEISHQVVNEPENVEFKENLNSELIVEEQKIDSEEIAEEVNDDAELSFHGTDSFLPDVKIEPTVEETVHSEIPKNNINKHEDEMRRLIEEVEKRMKARKESVPEITETEIENNHDISFGETQAFHVGEEQKAAEEVVVKEAELIVEKELADEKSLDTTETTEDVLRSEPESEVVSTWKPMIFESSRPDSLLNKPVEISKPVEDEIKNVEPPKVEEAVKEIPTEIESEIIASEKMSDDLNVNENTETQEEQNEDAPVMNVSFFGSGIASLGSSYKADQIERENAGEQQNKAAQQIADDSNVPGFINTWQSWLKIDRTEEIQKEKTEIKNKVIESFIENNPKISQLKDDVHFVVKEKTDDISHLMTETLANLYIEQKLYSKAINAFQILVSKFPERKEYFEGKIQEIKDSRGKN